jgi:thiamine-phosphate pyrophosphorylase
MKLPRLYPILDFSSFGAKPEPLRQIRHFAEQLIAGGATMLQYRDKSGDTLGILSRARELRRITQGQAKLIINDRFDICLAVQAEGVHLGQDDVMPAAARAVLDRGQTKERERRIVGFSTHTLVQVEEADSMPIDYLAVGPVFATGSKANPDPMIGLEGVRQARAATAKPLVAIGGITRKNCREVMDAGADAVAVISDLLESPVKAVEEFLRVLG